MKKNLISFSAIIIILSVVVLSCRKKDDEGINRPGYKEENGSGGNPFPNNPTVTGTPTSTNPATQNSSLYTGGTGWSNPTCNTSSVSLHAINGIIDVNINFMVPPSTGTYVIAASPGPSACTMLVTNAPNQPPGTLWYGKTGLVSVATGTNNSINCTFSGIVCTQQNFNFPQVSVTGQVSCN